MASDFGTDIYTRLTGYAPLSTLVGTRVYPVQFKQTDNLPAIRYNRITTERYHAMGVDCGVVSRTYQFDVIGSTYASTDAAKIEMVNALTRWKDANVDLHSTFIQNESDDYESDLKLYRIRVDVRFNIEEI